MPTMTKAFQKDVSPIRSAAFASLLWILAALGFNVLIWLFYRDIMITPEIGDRAAMEFFTAYVIEKSLSVDNLFVIAMIFRSFRIPVHQQAYVLKLGLWGAFAMRMAIILGGLWIVQQFHWVLYIFGALLVYTAYKILFCKDEDEDVKKGWMWLTLKKYLPLTSIQKGGEFLSEHKGKLCLTPLFVTLIIVEISDILFAFDSLPAVLAITEHPFIAVTSNMFAVLGLRSLYFLLAHSMDQLRYLPYGIAAILFFIGFKMLAASWVQVSTGFSLGFILGTLCLTMLASFIIKPVKTSVLKR